MNRRRWVAVGAVLLVAIVVGIFFGYLAGVALALGVLTIFLLGFSFDPELSQRPGRSWGEKMFGSDAAKRRQH
jgi:hypothetical protein